MKSTRTLNSPVLVLNKNWVAIGTTTVRDAIVAISREAAKGLCVETFQTFDWECWVDQENPPKATGFIVAAGEKHVPAPDVVVLTRFGQLFKKSITFTTRALHRRDNYTCQYCKRRKPLKELSVDHVVPRARGGRTSWENCVTACIPCNQGKADRSLKETGLTLRPKPGKPGWSPVMHIAPEKRLPSWNKLVKETV